MGRKVDDIDVNFAVASDIAVKMQPASDIAVSFAEASDMNIHFPSNIIGAGFGAEYQDVFDAYDTEPDFADADVDNTMVEGLVADSVWAKLDYFGVFANHITGADSLRNWIIPANTATVFNAPAFGQWEGYTGNGLNAYIDCNWNPNTDGINYTQDDASFGIYIRTDNIVNAWDCGVRNSAHWNVIGARFVGDNAILRVNSQGNTTYNHTDSRGFWIGNRLDSTDQDLYRNKIRVADSSQISTGIPNKDFYVLARNRDNDTPDSFSNRQASLFFAGAGITQTDIDNIYDRFQTRMTFHGTQV